MQKNEQHTEDQAGFWGGIKQKMRTTKTTKIAEVAEKACLLREAKSRFHIFKFFGTNFNFRSFCLFRYLFLGKLSTKKMNRSDLPNIPPEISLDPRLLAQMIPNKKAPCFRKRLFLWAHLGSNQGPPDYESGALTN